MARARNSLQGKPPKCSKCGKAPAHVTLREPGDPKSGNTWLCASCELLRENPAATIAPVPEIKDGVLAGRKRPLQKERLFDV